MSLDNPLPYGKQQISEDDIQAVCDVLRSDFLTTGPVVERFEQQVAAYTHTRYGVAVNSGTAALHAAMNALGIGPGDEVIVPPITFAATANAVVYQGGTPVFADVDSDTLLIDPDEVEAKITSNTRAVVAVDYAGQMCDYPRLKKITQKYGLSLVSDACHAIGGSFEGHPAGSLADMSIFSFHPVKGMTTGEGGMVVTNDLSYAQQMRQFRSHGINRDFQTRQASDSWVYEIRDLGYNYRLTDFQCALGISQLKQLDVWIDRRNEIATEYDRYFSDHEGILPLKKQEGIRHAYHLYVVKVDFNRFGVSRADLFSKMNKSQIHLNVHYIPVHLHPFYTRNMATYKGMCPVSEQVYEEIVSIPVFPGMQHQDIDRVCQAFARITAAA